MKYKIIGTLNVLLIGTSTCFAQHKTEYSNQAHTVKEWIEYNQYICRNKEECLYYQKMLEMIKNHPMADLELATTSQLSSQENYLVHKDILQNKEKDKKHQNVDKDMLMKQWMLHTSLLE